jgi:hypothetical protein
MMRTRGPRGVDKRVVEVLSAIADIVPTFPEMSTKPDQAYPPLVQAVDQRQIQPCRRVGRRLRELRFNGSANMALNSIKTPARLSGDKHWHSAEAEPHIPPGPAAPSLIRRRRPPVWVRTESVDRYQSLLLPIEGGVPPHSLNQSVRKLRCSATVWRCVREPLWTEHLDSNLKQDSDVVS